MLLLLPGRNLIGIGESKMNGNLRRMGEKRIDVDSRHKH
jgi:hypothetical protein